MFLLYFYCALNELRQLLRNIGEFVSEQDLKTLMFGADTDGNEMIDYEEFKNFMLNK